MIQLRYKRITEKFDITGEGDGTPPIEDLKIRRFSKGEKHTQNSYSQMLQFLMAATGVELEAVVTVGGVERTLFISNTPHKSHNDEAVVLENGNILAMAERKEHYEVSEGRLCASINVADYVQTDYIVAPGVDLVVITILCYMVDDAEMSDEDDERRRRESF